MGTILMKYNPSSEYKTLGYHKTFATFKQNIIENGFRPSKDQDDWLGEGVYFWESLSDAKWWKSNQSKNGFFKPCIFICNISCKLENYLNLNLEMEKATQFCRQYMKELKRNGQKKPHFQNSNEKKKFFCDIYCSENKIDVLSYEFDHDIINEIGFKTGSKKRKQICVRNADCIEIISIEE